MANAGQRTAWPEAVSADVSAADVGSAALLAACAQSFFLLRCYQALDLLPFLLVDFTNALLFLRCRERSICANSFHFLPGLLSQRMPLLHG